MRLPLTFSLVLCAGFACSGLALADAAKEVTLTGTLTCGHCALKETKACQSVLQVKEGDKTVEYFLADNKTAQDTHKNVCRAPKDNVTVTGTVEEKDGKKVITPTKVVFPAEK